jgi:sialic acid synthase SpsE
MDNIWVKRPGTGEILERFNELMQDKKNCFEGNENDEQLRLEDIEIPKQYDINYYKK